MTEDQVPASLEKGILFAQQGEPKQARLFLSQAVLENPKSATAWYWLSLVIEDPERKIYCFSKAVSLDPAIAEKSPGLSSESEKFPFSRHNPSVENTPAQAKQPESRTDNPAASAQAPQSTPGVELPSSGSKPSTPPGSRATSTKQSSQVKDKPQRSRRLSPPIRILFGVLIFLVVVGLPLTYLAFSGSLAGLMPLLGLGQTDVPNTPIFADVPTLTSILPTSTIATTPMPTAGSEATAAPVLNTEVPPQSVAAEMSSAAERMAAADYPNAVVILDRVISLAPDHVEAYYQRGLAYLKMTDSIGSQDEYLNSLKKSLADFDLAIEMGPIQADYFVQRANVLWRIGNEMEYTIDRDPFYAAALDNIHLGIAYGTAISGVRVDAARLHDLNGQCSTGLSELEELEELTPSTTGPYFEIESALAETYLCLGQYAKALDKIDEALNCNCDSSQYDILKAEILYFYGDKDLASVILDKDIQESPGFPGDRYYLRALIYFGQGNYELARADLATGAANTWWHGGLYPYLLSKLAVLNGDRENARSLLRTAQASLRRDENPDFVQWIKDYMAVLGVTPLSPTPQLIVDITPMPASFYDSLPPASTPTLQITP